MVEPIPLKPKDDYSNLMITRIIDGEPIEYVDIDAMTEDQFKKFCRDTGTEYFRRLGVSV